MSDTRIRLVVLFGGQSAEHDVSCVSGRHVLAAADPQTYRVEPVGITRDGAWVRAEEAMVALERGVAELPDRLSARGPSVDPLPVLDDGATETGGPTVVFPTLHGPMGEDGTVQGLLELAGVPYVGAGVLASALCMDKVATKRHLAHAGVAQAAWRTMVLDDPASPDEVLRPEIDQIVAELGLPVFVKPANMGSSVGVSRAATPPEIAEALRLASTYDRRIVVEEEVRGREIEVALLGNDPDARASLPGEIVPGADFYDYADKYEDGAELRVPAPLTDDEVAAAQQVALDAYGALGVEGLARVDLFYEDGGSHSDGRPRGRRGWLVNEVNTMPGFTPISMYPKLWDVTGVCYRELIDELVELALARHRRDQAHRRTDH